MLHQTWACAASSSSSRSPSGKTVTGRASGQVVALCKWTASTWVPGGTGHSLATMDGTPPAPSSSPAMRMALPGSRSCANSANNPLLGAIASRVAGVTASSACAAAACTTASGTGGCRAPGGAAQPWPVPRSAAAGAATAGAGVAVPQDSASGSSAAPGVTIAACGVAGAALPSSSSLSSLAGVAARRGGVRGGGETPRAALRALLTPSRSMTVSSARPPRTARCACRTSLAPTTLRAGEEPPPPPTPPPPQGV